MNKVFCSKCVYLHEEENTRSDKDLVHVCAHPDNSKRIDSWYAEKDIRVYEDYPSSINCKNDCKNYKEI